MAAVTSRTNQQYHVIEKLRNSSVLYQETMGPFEVNICVNISL